MERFKFLPKDKISRLPQTAGVYALKRGAEFLYIGKAANIRERVKNHFHPVKQFRRRRNSRFAGFNRVKQIGYLSTCSEVDALILEANLIKKYQPRYNVVWRDDKNYFYVVATKENFPRIFWTHQPIFESRIRNKELGIKNKDLHNSSFIIPNSKFQFVGPFVDGKALKQALKLLRKVFPYRSCRQIPHRPCLWYHLNRCPGPCLLKISAYRGRPPVNFGEKMKKECQKNAKNLMRVLKEGKNPLLKELTKAMKKASKNQGFESAAKIRDQIEALKKVVSHAKIFSGAETSAQSVPRHLHDKGWRKTEKELRKILGIKKKISRIEAYDVSNIQGQNATGSMATFVKGAPDKNFYRRFKIKISGRPDDVAMLKEVLKRRFCHPEWGWPDLILIDGGRPQLNAAINSKLQVLSSKHIKALALAKKHNELFIEGRKKPIRLDSLSNSLKFAFLQLRDEAHRFAISYHKKLRHTNFFNRENF